MKRSHSTPGRICVFARPPILGRVKTRLASGLGEAAALALYEAFLLDGLEAAGASTGEVRLHLSEGLSDEVAPELRERLASLEPRLQVAGDLGARMAGAFALEAADGADTVAIVGSDLPGVTTGELEACLRAAAEGVVLAPTEDGGFWCVAGPAGLDWASLFASIAWSSGSERQAVEARLRAAGLAGLAGPPGLDVDDLEDLRRVARALEAAAPEVGRRSREVLSGLGEAVFR